MDEMKNINETLETQKESENLIKFTANSIKTYYYDSGKKQYIGKTSWGSSNGLWTFWNENESIKSEINLNNEKREGEQLFYENNGNPRQNIIKMTNF